MAVEKSDLLTAGTIAQTLGVSVPQMKKAVHEIGLKPAAKNGLCREYLKVDKSKIKHVLKK